MKVSRNQLSKIVRTILHEQRNVKKINEQKSSNVRSLARLAWTDEQEDGIILACQLAQEAGYPITHGERMPEWPRPAPVLLDVEYNDSSVNVDLDGEITVHGNRVTTPEEFAAAYER